MNTSQLPLNPQGGGMAFGNISIKAYFEKIRELHKSGEKYPVNLDDVWPLVYAKKQKALNTLIKEYTEGEDFYLTQMGKLVKSAELKSGIKIECFLSVSAMEYFIAKKIKEVFDVYRQIFHKAADQIEKPMSMVDLMIQSALMHKDHQAKFIDLDNRLNAVESKVVTHPDSYTVMGYAITHKIKGLGLQMAARIGAWAKAKCKREGIKVESTPDPRFGRVCVFPTFILEEAFNTLFF